MSKITAAVNWAIGIAVDDSHGYSWGGWGPDYDCGHLVIMAWENAGVHVRAAGASYTGDMRPSFLRCGFDDVTGQVNVNTGTGLQIGDVLVNQDNHAAMYIGNGRIVQARSNLDGVAGDSSGQEIRTQAYYNYPWDCVLRYRESVSPAPAPSVPTQPDSGQTGKPTLRRGMSGPDVKEAQELLIKAGYSVGPDGADGKFGANTFAAVKDFQKAKGLTQDSVIGPKTWTALEQAAAAPKSQTAPAATPAATDAGGGYTIYTVKKGDTLWNLAGKHLGSFLRYPEIMKLNGLKSIIIKEGQQLKLPTK